MAYKLMVLRALGTIIQLLTRRHRETTVETLGQVGDQCFKLAIEMEKADESEKRVVLKY